MKKELKELLQTGSTLCKNKPLETVQLDYSCAQHLDYIFSLYGGEIFIKENYPLVYQAILNTKNAHLKQKNDSVKCANQLGDDLKEKIYNINMIHYAIDPVAQNGVGKSAPDKAAIENFAVINPVKKIPHITATGWMENCTLQSTLDSYFLSLDDIDSETELPLSAHIEDILGMTDKKIVSHCNFQSITEENDQPLLNSFVAQTPEFTMSGISSYIEKFSIDDPKSACNNDPLIVLYGRVPVGETADYSMEYNFAVNNQVNVILPIKGKIKFKPAVTPMGFSRGSASNIKLTLLGEGDVEYNHSQEEMNNFFSIDAADNSLSFVFDKNWNSKLDISRLGAKAIFKVICSFFILVKEQNSVREVGCSIDSVQTTTYYTSDKPTVYVPSVGIRWGCFGRETYITMSSGEQKRIDDICINDKIRSANGGVVRVTDIITGHEKTIILIETTTGKQLHVSFTHPVETKRGTLQAIDIKPNDAIKLADGTYVDVKFIYEKAYGDTVYNLRTSATDNHMIIANDFVAGDYDAQNAFQKVKENNEKPLSQITLETIKQMKALEQARFGSIQQLCKKNHQK